MKPDTKCANCNRAAPLWRVPLAPLWPGGGWVFEFIEHKQLWVCDGCYAAIEAGAEAGRLNAKGNDDEW